MTRFPAYALIALLCASPLIAQEENQKRETPNTEVLEQQIEDLRAALSAAKDRLAVTQAALRKNEEVAAKAKKAADEYRARAESAWEEAMEKLNQSKLDQLATMLGSVEKRVGREHAYANSLRATLLAQSGEYAAALQAATERYGPKHPKVLALKKQLGHIKEATDRAADQGQKARDVERDALLADATAIKEQLAQTQTRYGKNHPRVKQLASQLQALDRRLSTKVKSEAQLKQQLADRMDALKDLERQLAASEKKEYFDEYRELAARERAELAAKMKLAERERAEELQDRRTKEMLVMQERLANATRLANESVAKARTTQGTAISALDKRMANVERKLDRIAELLEKMLDK